MNLLDLPTEVILHILHCLSAYDYFSKVNFMHTMYEVDRHDIYREHLMLYCLCAQVYCKIHLMSDEVLYKIRNFHNNAYFFFQWSPFAIHKNTGARPVAKIWWSTHYPHKQVHIYESSIRYLVKKQVSKRIYQGRLSVHLDSRFEAPGFTRFSFKFNSFYFHTLPLVVGVADAHDHCIVSNGKTKFAIPSPANCQTLQKLY